MGVFENRGCFEDKKEIVFDFLFENFWVKFWDLLGDWYFLLVEDKVYLWFVNIKWGSVVLLINWSGISFFCDIELFYGELELG